MSRARTREISSGSLNAKMRRLLSLPVRGTGATGARLYDGDDSRIVRIGAVHGHLRRRRGDAEQLRRAGAEEIVMKPIN